MQIKCKGEAPFYWDATEAARWLVKPVEVRTTRDETRDEARDEADEARDKVGKARSKGGKARSKAPVAARPERKQSSGRKAADSDDESSEGHFSVDDESEVDYHTSTELDSNNSDA